MTKRPGFSVGPVRVDPPLILAPMEDVTSLPMRLIAKRIAGPGLVFTEFVSAMAIHFGALKTFRKLKIHPDEKPLAIQIFGSDPDVMAETARLCEGAGADIVDINMGCWVPKVCRTGSGAALLKDPVAAESIVNAVVSAVSIPVTVKVRAGWDYSVFAAPELAKRFESAGAKMITLHARFAKQGFEGEANWDLIRELRDSVNVPFVGNGDVKSAEDAVRMLESTGCDGVMVGRAAISDPWRLSKIKCGLTGETMPPDPTLEDRIETALEHARMTIEEFEREPQILGPEYKWEAASERGTRIKTTSEQAALRSLRGQLPLYVKGFPGAAQVRGRLSAVDSYAELEDILRSLTTTEWELAKHG